MLPSITVILEGSKRAIRPDTICLQCISEACRILLSVPEFAYAIRVCTLTSRNVEPAPPAIGQTRAIQRPETIRLYAAEWSAFVAWCRAAKRVSLPADSETLTAYLLAVATKASRGTLGRKRAAIRATHRRHGLPLPALDPAARAAVRQAARPRPPVVEPVTSARAAWLRLAVQCPRDLAGLRDRALLLLAACERATAEELLGLEREQVRLIEAGVEIQLPRAQHTMVLIDRADPASCPVRALEDWLRASDTSFGPIFRKIDRWGNVEHARLGPDGLRRIVARRKACRGARSKVG